jgi:hypothetical protein
MSIYDLVLLWWHPKDKKVHEKRWNRDDQYKANVFKEKIIDSKSHIVGQFAVAAATGEYAGAW